VGCPETGHVDHIRGMTVYATGSAFREDVVKVELCPGARVYSYTITIQCTAIIPPEIGAQLLLQDSSIDIPLNGLHVVSFSAEGLDNGLAWPAFARLVAKADCAVKLMLTYGHCA